MTGYGTRERNPHPRIGEATPQSAPELFTRKAIMAEVRHLMRLNRVHGAHHLRTIAYSRLISVVAATDASIGGGQS
jgi:hypothetical protein